MYSLLLQSVKTLTNVNKLNLIIIIIIIILRIRLFNIFKAILTPFYMTLPKTSV